MQPIQTFTISDDRQMILAALRQHLPDSPSWTAVKKIFRARRVAIGGVVCVDEGRQLSQGDTVTVWDHPLPPPPTDGDVRITYVDADVVVAEKPSGMVTLRRKSDLNWSWARKNLQPTLDECVPRLIGQHAAGRRGKQRSLQRLPQLFPVHRIDRDTSGLLAFARSQESRTKIIRQFSDHAAVRKYFALIPGAIKDQTVTSHLVRDRGDGLRGNISDNSADKGSSQRAVTHFETLRRIKGFSELECRLETGRTNQIRIHLAELGHPICGDIKYRGPFGKPPVTDRSKIRRLALHAAELRFEHPTSGKPLHFQTPWPADMRRFLERLESSSK
jgi:23S rRNA pseudouridine1911/1915/1917 synthase